MAITLITGPANAGKAQLAMEAVRAHAARGAEPLLIVPTRLDAQHYLRELADGGAAIGVSVQPFAGLIELAARRAGLDRPALGGLARRRVLEVLSGASPGTVGALESIVAELAQRRVAPRRLSEALERMTAADGPQVGHPELARVYRDYHALLERLGRLDRDQRAARAMDALRLAPARWGATPVVFYGFDDLTPLQLDAIETLGTVVDADVTVSLSYEPGRAAFAGRATSFQKLAPLAREHRSLGSRAEHYAPASRAPLSHLERRLFEPDSHRVDPGESIVLLEGGGERAELELVASEVSGLLAQGVAAEEIAVVVRLDDPGRDLLEEIFAGAAIPFSMRRSRPFAASAIGRALLGLLRCVPDGDGADCTDAADAGELLAWLRAPGAIERPELVDALERQTRREGATGASAARASWERRHWPLEAIDRLAEAQARGPVALIDRVTRELARLFALPRRRQAAVLDAGERVEAAALAAGTRALSELRELARLAVELAPGRARELAAVLARVEVPCGVEPGPGLVCVLDPLALRARRVRALFVCGLQEGVFPARSRALPFLAEEERRRLAELTSLRLTDERDALADERHLLYAVLSRPQERLYLSWHVADDDGAPTSRSLFVDDVCDLFGAQLLERARRRPLGALDGARAWAAAQRASGEEPLRDERVLRRLRKRPWSASSLERWIGCPVSWFVDRLLRPDAFDADPEPLARGALAHAALADTFEALRRETGTARLTRARLERARSALAQALAENEQRFPLSVEPERATAARARLRADLERFLEAACESAGSLEPGPLELGFGFEATDDEEEPLPALELGGGVRLRGRIDRVDVGAGGEAIVYDYKSTQAPPAARWLSDANLQVALYMRAVEDLLGLRVVGGLYQPLSGPDLRPRGAIDGDSGVELECVDTDVRDRGELRELVDGAVAAALAAAAQAGEGRLQARPATCAFRGGCMYPTICRCER